MQFGQKCAVSKPKSFVETNQLHDKNFLEDFILEVGNERRKRKNKTVVFNSLRH